MSTNDDDDDNDNDNYNNGIGGGGDGVVRQTHAHVPHYLTKLFARYNHHRDRTTAKQSSATAAAASEERRRNEDEMEFDKKKKNNLVPKKLVQEDVASSSVATSSSSSTTVTNTDINIMNDSSSVISGSSSGNKIIKTDVRLLNKNPLIASGSRTTSCATLLSVQSPPSVLKNANISPQILRRTLYKLDRQKSKLDYTSTDEQHHHRHQQHYHHRQGGSMPDWPTTASGSGIESPVVGSRFGFMESRISRFQLKRLRTKHHSLMEQGVWKPSDNCTWRSTNGAELKLRGKRVEILSAVERQALQKIAFSRLQKSNLGCAVQRPKECIPLRQRRQKCSRRKAQTVNIVDRKKDGECKSPSPYGSHQVFGVPLSECIEYEQLLEDIERKNELKNNGHSSQHHPPSVEGSSSSQSPVQQFLEMQKQNRCQSLDLEEMDLLNVVRTSPLRLSGDSKSSKSSLSDQTSIDSLSVYLKPTSSKNSLYNQTSGEESQSSSADRRYASSDSLLGGGSPLCNTSRTSSSLSKQDSCEPHNRRVPKLVQSCTEYLKEYGLRTVGLFRVAGSAKRCRQLRLELDSGMEIVLADEEPELYPHDVATLLKEYFRDLPDPLLTKELYPAFVNSAKFSDEQFIDILRYLICLLPLANSDTLLVLLQFLRQVAKHSHDTINDQGVLVSGNKMNAHNLATIFGPTILRPGTNRRLQHWSDNESVIRVVETMINNCDEIYSVPKELQDSVYKNLQETDPDSLDNILTRMLTANQQTLPEDQEELEATVYLSSQEELDPPVVTKEDDGTTVVKTRQQTTHRIIYTVHKPTGKILSSSRESSSGTLSKTYQEEAEGLDTNFIDMSLTENEEPRHKLSLDSPLESTNRNTSSSYSNKSPVRKITPLTKLTDVIRPGSPKK